MSIDGIRGRLLNLTALASQYCVEVENASERGRNEFVATMLQLLPKIYLEFNDIRPSSEKRAGEEDVDEFAPVDLGQEEKYYADYVDEDYYENVRRHMETLLGPDDTYLETFEEDMKYSDTPIAASISESLADIFQPLYNYVSIVRDTDGEELEGAYRECHADFASYWSQTLCNVLRALNKIYYESR